MGFVFSILSSFIWKRYSRRIIYALLVPTILGIAYFLYTRYENIIIDNARNRLQLEQLTQAERERERVKTVIEQLTNEGSALADMSDEETRLLMKRRDELIRFVMQHGGDEPVPSIVRDVLQKLN